MFKCIALLKAKPGLTRAALIEYYETKHAPLIRSLLPEIERYTRNFLCEGDRFTNQNASAVDFDVVTEMWFADRAAYDRFVARATEPDIAAQIAADEENVFDRTRTRMFVVEERTTAGIVG
jgi:uncharacterized protein (TIGR02118 family)